jgi:uncharacterized protein YkwD
LKAGSRNASILMVLLTICLLSRQTVLSQDVGPPPQPASLVHDEMRTVYLGNLARRDNGVPPLRWNVQMTDAARWFSWDSVENRPGGYCGHDDTLGRTPWERVPASGYRGFVGAENCFCGYVTPEYAITGWINSAGHRNNLLNPNYREVGLGYYRRDSDGRGYVTQDFGGPPPPPLTPVVWREGCEPFTWSVADNAAWLHVQPVGENVQVSVDTAGLITDTYYATITFEAEAGVLGSPIQVPSP